MSQAHEAAPGEPRPASINPYDNDSQDFWTGYRAGRPQIPDSFFERVFDYHAEHSQDSGWHIVHDAGAGPGIHTPRLAPRFDKVIVSDASADNVTLAKEGLLNSESVHHADKFEFHVMKFEDTGSALAPGSVDLIFAATMLHFCHIPSALESAARQLRPGGTFAAFLTAIPVLDDVDLQHAWLDLIHTGTKNYFASVQGTPAEDALIKVMALTANGYDVVDFEGTAFRPGVVRLALVDDDGPSIGDRAEDGWYRIIVPPFLRDRVPRDVSKIGSQDRVLREQGGEEWKVQMDCETLKRNLHTMPYDFEAPEIAKRWAELERLMAGRVVSARWDARLLLATRK